MTNQHPKTTSPFEVPSIRRWNVGGIYVTLKPAEDGLSIRIYTKGRKDLGKCGVVMKIRRTPVTPDRPTLSEKVVNTALEFMMHHQRLVAAIVYLDQLEDGTVRVSLDKAPTAFSRTIDGTQPAEMVAALCELTSRAAAANDPASPDELARLNERFTAARSS